MKLKKTVINQNLIKKILNLNSIFVIFCSSDLNLNSNYKVKKLCKINFKYPNILFKFNYLSRVQNYLLDTQISLIFNFFKFNYDKLKTYGFAFFYYKFIGFKEFKKIFYYYFNSIKLINFFKILAKNSLKLSSSNGKDIALSR